MQFPASQFTEALASVIPHAAGIYDTLPALATVAITANTDRIVLMATDRYTAAEAFVSYENEETNEEVFSALISVQDAKALLSAAKRASKAYAAITVSNDDWRRVSFTFTTGETLTYRSPLGISDFPLMKVRELLDEAEGGYSHPQSAIGFTAGYLSRYAVAAKAYGTQGVQLRFLKGNVFATLRGVPTFRSVIMPLRD